MGLIRFNDRQSYPTFSSMMDDFFKHTFSDMGATNFGGSTPAVNIKNEDTSFGLEVALPGLTKDQVNIELENNVLTISSAVKEENEESHKGYTRREFGYRSFQRSFTLPEVADQEHIDASFEHGVLTITIPKRSEKELKNTRTISIG